ncbi:MAG: LOG family protein [Candidatus Terrybacteria bacterium]|nr:LOG family protein [Candidatus Terrybacteria bacterium]
MATKLCVRRFQYKICVSGASDASACPKDAVTRAREVGREIVRRGGVIVTGATSGIPYEAAKAARAAGGLSIGFSPAASAIAHTKTYRLPTDAFDIIVYTGFDYSGRNLILTRAADALITICGRVGTLNEFTVAFEDRKPIGVLAGSGGTADRIKEIVEPSGRPWKWKQTVFEHNPRTLVAKVIALIDDGKVERRRRSARRKR